MGLAYESPTILDQANNLKLACIKQIQHVDGCAGCKFCEEVTPAIEIDGIKIKYEPQVPRFKCRIGYPNSWVLPKED
ncbi:MAG: hypothetical protein J6U54_16035 [Clostridiales bacterium]|nr:hypothetical protein [Clostridiales bacterium]